MEQLKYFKIVRQLDQLDDVPVGKMQERGIQ